MLSLIAMRDHARHHLPNERDLKTRDFLVQTDTPRRKLNRQDFSGEKKKKKNKQTLTRSDRFDMYRAI